MKRITLMTRQGRRVFSVRDKGGHVRCNGQWICVGGRIEGPALRCAAEDLEAVARKWWTAYRRRQREGR